MQTTLIRRVAKLESSAAVHVTIYGWQDEGETAEQAIARQYPAGVPGGNRYRLPLEDRQRINSFRGGYAPRKLLIRLASSCCCR
jgi:hypothetical protein